MDGQLQCEYAQVGTGARTGAVILGSKVTVLTAAELRCSTYDEALAPERKNKQRKLPKPPRLRHGKITADGCVLRVFSEMHCFVFAEYIRSLGIP